MNKYLVNFLCVFIPNRKRRHDFREKYFKSIETLIEEYINKVLNNFQYGIVDLIKNNKLDTIKIPNVKSSEETLNYLLENNNASMVRFGDGEFMIIMEKSVGFQKKDTVLAKRLSEILLEGSNPQLLCCIPDCFGYLKNFDNKINFWRKFLIDNRQYVYKHINFDKIYYDTSITRPYMGAENKENNEQFKNYFNKFKQIWENKNIIIVEGEKSRLGVGNDLFDNAKQVERILCPAISAFDKYDEILSELKLQDKNKLILIALGMTATVLGYDLHKIGFRALDIGHIDIEYEWFLMGATEKVAVKNKFVLETGNVKVGNIQDEKYLSQIIKKIL